MNDRALEEVFLSSEQVFHGCLIDVEHWQVRLPDGQQALREVVLHRGAAAIVPLDDAGNVTLVRQHRIAAGRFTWEIPAGKLDHVGEDMLDCARRELEEETGLRAANFRLLTVLDTTPGFCNERIGIYLATGLSQHAMHTDADEFLNVAAFPLSEAVRRVMAGEIRDSKTAVGLLMAWQLRNGEAAAPFDSLSTIQRNTGAFSSRASD
ncbi:MAG: NUDIX hydrolase [Clostridia bacterium]|nr:NUDIX hydrolase [Clostridia bacterium]